ncbi:hypothetical protein ACWCQ0_43000 [Streptomyces massasporeus]|uniref:hypothetical protein n=1 Tax=Streptomyces massasporeus TaxID=67324 RepID=UPI0033FC7F50
MNVDIWALVAVAVAGIVAGAAVLIAAIALKGTGTRDRAGILHAAADLVRAIRGRK